MRGEHGAGAVVPARAVRLGLRENAAQFALLVLVNAFVGAMVGVERSVLPLLAEREFGVASATAALGFLVAFGLAKSGANYLAGGLAGRVGRRRILLAGWIAAPRSRSCWRGRPAGDGWSPPTSSWE